MNLNLKSPIAFFDLESTGINISTDRIVEFSILKVHPNGRQEIKTSLINPTIPIPAESSAIHGIFDKDVNYAVNTQNGRRNQVYEFEYNNPSGLPFESKSLYEKMPKLFEI